MSVDVGLELTGADELIADLRLMADRTPRELTAVYREGAEIVAARTRSNMAAAFQTWPPANRRDPVTPLVQTVRTRATIRGSRVEVGGLNAPHAGVTEFGGHLPRRGNKGIQRPRSKQRGEGYASLGISVTTRRPNPTLYPAAEQEADNVVDHVVDALVAIGITCHLELY
jgi:hypothetical protein